jgi:predicted NBD/HSP70 family sugar kinase
MPKSIGIAVTEHLAMGVVEGGQVSGSIARHPTEGSLSDQLRGMPAEELAGWLGDEVKAMAEGQPLEAVGLAFPGIVRNGVIEDSPNLPQFKGFAMETAVGNALARRGIPARVGVSNDADVVASGIASAHGRLDKLVRVWTLGDGIGFGHYPVSDGVWEGGHMVVTLDPNEKFCGCGGRGHLEGIMGNRAMRLRFLDMEPEEVFAAAKSGDRRSSEFVLLWHRALAAATASSIHMDGAGKFYVTGPNARFLNLALLNGYVEEMVHMSPLQGYVFEIMPQSDDLAIVGAVVNALRR